MVIGQKSGFAGFQHYLLICYFPLLFEFMDARYKKVETFIHVFIIIVQLTISAIQEKAKKYFNFPLSDQISISDSIHHHVLAINSRQDEDPI